MKIEHIVSFSNGTYQYIDICISIKDFSNFMEYIDLEFATELEIGENTFITTIETSKYFSENFIYKS